MDVLARAVHVVHDGSMLSSFYRPHKDVLAMPYAVVPPGLIRTPLTQRKQLAMSMGSRTTPIRKRVFDLFAGDPDVLLVEGHLSQAEYWERLRDTRFCLHLCGWSPQLWSGRIAHIVAAGCIVVVICDNLQLPFPDRVDWHSVSLRVAEAEVEHLKERLARVSAADLAALQANMDELAETLILQNAASAPVPGGVLRLLAESMADRARWNVKRLTSDVRVALASTAGANASAIAPAACSTGEGGLGKQRCLPTGQTCATLDAALGRRRDFDSLGAFGWGGWDGR